MNLVDIFNGDAFSVQNLTASIQQVPTLFGRLNGSGLFTPKPINTSHAVIEIENGVLNLIPASERGTAAPKNKRGKRKAKSFEVPRIALDDRILPSDIQNVRQFGTENLLTVETAVNDTLEKMSKKHQITGEFHKCGAISGIIYDADGEVLVDLFDEFDVEEVSVNIDFADPDEDIDGKLEQIKDGIEDALGGDTFTHVAAECSPEFYAGLTGHPKVREAFQFYQALQQRVAPGLYDRNGNVLRDDMSQGFDYKGIVFYKNRSKSTFLKDDGTVETRKFIAAGKARFYPVGTTDTFVEAMAPADWMETVNTLGQELYAKVVVDNGGRWADVLTQSLRLPLCTRPGALAEGAGNFT
jgi:hypothetical protein